MDDVVIIGAGQAGGWVAKTLRAQGFDGRITLIGAEAHAPYERPPLSKAVLLGEADPGTTALFSESDFAALELSFLPGTRAEAIDRAVRAVTTDDGQTVGYDKLVIATGGTARPLPVPGAAQHALYLRSRDDAVVLHERLVRAKNVAIVGGGWIGLEVAAAATKLGAAVTVYEAAERLCGRAVPPEVSDYLFDLHTRHGVTVHLNAAVERIDAGTVTVDGATQPVDLVMAGIGLVPDTALAAAAGLAVDNGILVDGDGRTSDPDIHAVGDVANRDSPVLGRRVRLESWGNAQDQGVAVAKHLLGIDPGEEGVPWFWSDQYDVNMQILGLPEAWGSPVRRPGDGPDRFSLFYLDGARLTAVVAANNAMDIKIAKRLMAADKAVDPHMLADPAANLRDLLR